MTSVNVRTGQDVVRPEKDTFLGEENPFAAMMSLTPYGMPCSTPRYLPAAMSLSAAAASASARASVSSATQLSCGL